MAQTKITPLSSSDWFLVSNKDSLSIKIRTSITIGEDALGLLMLNSTAAAERWFTLTVDPEGHLEVSDLMPGIHFEAPGKWSTNSAGALLPAGTVIAMPNNELYVSQDLQRGKAALKVKVTTQTVATEVPILEQAANSSDDLLAVESIVVSLPYSELPAAPETAAPVRTERFERAADTHLVPRWMVFAAPIMVLCTLAAGVYYVVSQVPEQAEPALVPERSEPVETLTTEPLPDAASPRPSPRPLAPPVETAMSQDIFKEVSTPLVAEKTTAVSEPETNLLDVDVPGQLARARRLLDQGYINWPVDQNAAFILGTLLASLPDLNEALVMLDEAAEVMIAQARGAYGDGFQDSAIRVLEEVMVFHPNYAPARELHMDWLRERQVQFIDSATQDRTVFDAQNNGSQ